MNHKLLSGLAVRGVLLVGASPLRRVPASRARKRRC
jgi:hypothetical protein